MNYATDIVKLTILGLKYRNIASEISQYRDITNIFGGLDNERGRVEMKKKKKTLRLKLHSI